MEPEGGFEPGSAGYKATVLPFELSSIDITTKVLLKLILKINVNLSLTFSVAQAIRRVYKIKPTTVGMQI